MTFFLNFSPNSSHLHSLQVENCGSNSQLVVDEDDYGKFRIERVKLISLTLQALKYVYINHGDQRVLFNLESSYCLLSIHLNTYVMGLYPL